MNKSIDEQKQRAVFNLLWDLWHELEEHEGYGHGNNYGTIISRYAGVIDDRIANSGHSRSTLSLKLFTEEQLKDELESRHEDE